jgi:hypothetical protein
VNDPAAHGWHETDKVLKNLPEGHVPQTRLLEEVGATVTGESGGHVDQAVQLTLSGAVEKKPAAHVGQTRLEVRVGAAAVYLPAAQVDHGWQVIWFGAAVKVPAAQSEHKRSDVGVLTLIT